MSAGANWREKLDLAKDVCEETLASGMRLLLPDAVQCYQILEKVTTERSWTAAETLRGSQESPSGVFERALLLRASLEGIRRADRMPVCDGVKSVWADEILSFARPPAAWASMFAFRHVRYREMVQIATWQRFPAGQLHWDLTGLPRSFLFKAPPGELPAVLSCWLRNLRGFRPFIETHLNDRRRNRLTLTEAEGIKSYYLMAKSLELQPQVRGLLGIGWLYSPETARVSPRLAWLRDYPLAHGGLAISSVGPAPQDAGFLVGSEERRQLFEQGLYRPGIGCLIWPRQAMLDWAARTPDPFPEMG